MQKAVFIKSLSEKLALPEATLTPVVENVFQTLAEALIEGSRIEIRGFGVFSVRMREAKIGRNPKTGTPVSLPKMYSPHFQVSREIQKNFS
jgi:integration host factor subunit beta